MEMLVSGQICRLHTQQILDCPGDIVAFADLGGMGHGPLEHLLRHLGMLGQSDSDIGQKSRAHLRRVQHRAVAGDHARPLQLLHPAQTGRGRQPDPVGQNKVADPTVPRQLSQYTVVYGIYLRHLLQEY